MKKYLSTLVVLLILILTLSGCGGGSNTTDSGNNSSNNSSTTTDSNASNDTAANNNSSGTSTTNSNIVGDWKFVGDVNDVNYEINLDLENDGTYSLDVEDTSKDEAGESEMEGTYTASDKVLSLTTTRINDDNQYFTNGVVTDSVVDLNYTIDGKALTISNANSVLGILPTDLILTRDD